MPLLVLAQQLLLRYASVEYKNQRVPQNLSQSLGWNVSCADVSGTRRWSTGRFNSQATHRPALTEISRLGTPVRPCSSRFLWPSVSLFARLPLAVYAVVMAATLVHTGEHQVVDVAAGWLIAAFVVGAAVAARSGGYGRHREPAQGSIEEVT